MKNHCRRPSRSKKEPRLGFRLASTLEGWDSTTMPSGGNDARTSSLPARPRPDWVFIRRPSPVDLPQVYHCSTAIQASASAWAPSHSARRASTLPPHRSLHRSHLPLRRTRRRRLDAFWLRLSRPACLPLDAQPTAMPLRFVGRRSLFAVLTTHPRQRHSSAVRPPPAAPSLPPAAAATSLPRLAPIFSARATGRHGGSDPAAATPDLASAATVVVKQP